MRITTRPACLGAAATATAPEFRSAIRAAVRTTAGAVAGAVAGAALWTVAGAAPAAAGPDPFAANNGLYPDAQAWSGPFRVANLAYPRGPVGGGWTGAAAAIDGPISVATAPAYVAALKAHLEPTLRGMIETPHQWSPEQAGWWDMVWSGQGSPGADGATDPASGREALLNTYTGQIIPARSLGGDPQVPAVQNHAVIYYNPPAAGMLGQLWRDPFRPDLTRTQFPEGAIVVKAEAATPTPEQWPILADAAVWRVFRPALGPNGQPAAEASVIEARALQMSVAVKDTAASPQTGWVYVGFVYDAQAPGAQPWDRFVPMGAQWGNDPQFARDPDGLPPGETLRETWINPDAPAFIRDTLGWGGRLSGPMDVATRHEVITTDGRRYSGDEGLHASSCMSCHGTAQTPFAANLYPSPNLSFPRDGTTPFLLYEPGSADWARWYENRPGWEAMSGGPGSGFVGLDYDMVVMFALNAYYAATGNTGLVFEHFDAH